MKSSSLVSFLSLCGIGFVGATENSTDTSLEKRQQGGVDLCTDINWQGTCGYKKQPFDLCIQLSSPYYHTISSIGPDKQNALVFSEDSNCAGNAYTMFYPGSADLRNQGWNDRIGSFRGSVAQPAVRNDADETTEFEPPASSDEPPRTSRPLSVFSLYQEDEVGADARNLKMRTSRVQKCTGSTGVQSVLTTRARPPIYHRLPYRHQSTQADSRNASRRSLSVPATARFNDLGVQHVSSHVHSQLFTGPATRPRPEYVELSKDHLRRHDLLGKNTDSTPPVAFDLPALQGASLDEHFHKLGMDAAEPYLSMASKFARANPPPRPRKWVKRSGWTKYNPDGSSEPVQYPDESVLSFDTEVMWKETKYPAMACAVSESTWYGWMSPWLLQESDTDCHLVPLGPSTEPRLVVGHNIGYDRARILEEYSLEQSKTYFMDTMSLHVAVNGMCTRQRPTWMKSQKARNLRDEIAKSSDGADLHSLLESRALDDEEEHLWVGRSSINSLRDVAKFHCGITIDKARREYFGELDRAGIVERYEELMDYCAADVDVTHRVYRKVLPAFLETCPHPVSFAALRHLSAEVLPVNETWQKYIEDAEATFHKMQDAVQARLFDLAQKALLVKDQREVYENDPWLCQLDWSGQEIKYAKPKKKGEEPKPFKRQKMPGMPMWYKDLFPVKDGPINLTVRTRVAPLLLRLAWDGHPLVWSQKHGWVFRVLTQDAATYNAKALTEADMSEEEDLQLRHDHRHRYFKLPHKDGPAARCASPLAKGYLSHFEQGTLSSEYEYAKAALEMNASCSYWISARERIKSQMVVYEQQLQPQDSKTPLGFILPQVIPMGTITRRSVENTWLTASNAKKNRVGSELKSMIRAPPGYYFVGADVDSQELWIASLMGDAQFKQHGGNAIGFMTLEGTKAAGTDLHSKTAGILGISRNDAKVFNYGRIYGAGLNFAQTLLKQFNAGLTTEQCADIAGNLYRATKGQKTLRKVLNKRSFWRGGTESLVFNTLENFAEQEKPRTPVLGAGITEALTARFIGKGEFMTSRVNWAIQSSGVDYLHLLIVSMDYLARRYNIEMRLAITVHDEIRYLVREQDKYRAAMALQVANLWTRAMFSQQMGIDDLPQSCAYFSAVDIDHVLRKEVDMDCVTPSHPTAIAAGESLDIEQLLAKGSEAHLDPAVTPRAAPEADKYPYAPRTPVMSTMLDESAATLRYLQAQIATDEELKDMVKEIKKEEAATAGPAKVPKLSRRAMSIPKRHQPQGVTLREVPWQEQQRMNGWDRPKRAAVFGGLEGHQRQYPGTPYWR